MRLCTADFFTKPLQGSLFKLMREIIIGYRDREELFLTALEERVGIQDILSQPKKPNIINQKKESTYADVVTGRTNVC